MKNSNGMTSCFDEMMGTRAWNQFQREFVERNLRHLSIGNFFNSLEEGEIKQWEMMNSNNRMLEC